MMSTFKKLSPIGKCIVLTGVILFIILMGMILILPFFRAPLAS